MRKFLFGGMLCMLLSISGVFAQGVTFNQGAMQSDVRLITVSGEAQVNVVPDEIVVSIGVQACGDTASEARDNEAILAKSVMGVTKELGIDQKNVQTNALELDLVKPEYYDWRVCYDNKEPKKYGARQMFVITLKDVSKLTPLLTRTLEAGAIRVMGVEYRTTKLRQYRDQARSMAVKAAKEKATAMAADLEQKVGKPHTITENPTYGRDWYYYGSWWYYRSTNSMANVSQNVSSDPGTGGTSEDIALGQIAVTARVTVSFELE